jgi:2-phospho-L-lactate guanylyltransferase
MTDTSHILIPFKGLSAGKTRLSASLDEAARRAISEALYIQTLERAAAVFAADCVTVVTPDAEAAEMARSRSFTSVPDPGTGLNESLDAGRSAILLRPTPRSLLILPVDLPLASPDAIMMMFDCAGDVIIAPDERNAGTNVLLLRGAAVANFAFAFGAHSYSRHLAIGTSRGLDVKTVRDPRLAFDIDEPAHLERWVNHSRAG